MSTEQQGAALSQRTNMSKGLVREARDQARKARTSASARRAEVALIASTVAVALLLLSASVASAAISRPWVASFGPDGLGGSETFENADAITVDQETGDIFVLDQAGGGSLYKFDSEGHPADFSLLGTNVIEGVGVAGTENSASFRSENQLAIAPPGAAAGTAGDIYLANGTSSITVLAPSGLRLGEIQVAEHTCGVAVDTSGHVFAGVYAGEGGPYKEGGYESYVNEYLPTANQPFAAQLKRQSEPSLPRTCNVAVRASGQVYAAPNNIYAGSEVAKLESIDAPTHTLFAYHGTSVTIDRANGHLIVAGNGEGREFDSTDKQLLSFGDSEMLREEGKQITAQHQIGINESNGDVYVSTAHTASYDPGSVVLIFGPPTIFPEAKVGAAAEIGSTKATVTGTVSAAGGPETTCMFQYVSKSEEVERPLHTFAGAKEAPCEPEGPFTGTGDDAVSASLINLVPHMQYRYRLLAKSQQASEVSGPGFFTTAYVLAVETTAASELSVSGGILNGTVNPEREPVTECFFEYGPTTDYGSTAPCADPDAAELEGNAPVAVHARAPLPGGTESHFRLVARSALGVAYGDDMVAQTPGAAVSKATVKEVGTTEGTLRTFVNPNGTPATYVFEYLPEAQARHNEVLGQDPFYGAAAIPPGGRSISAGTVPVPVSARATGLYPATSYRLRAMTIDTAGRVYGVASTFTTRSGAPGFSPCADDVFRTGTGGALPDCRAYEQATPVDKAGSNANGIASLVEAAGDGDGVTYFNQSGVPGGVGAQNFPSFLASRATETWSTQGMLPRQDLADHADILGFTPDLRYVITYGSKDGLGTALFATNTKTHQVSIIVPYTNVGEGELFAYAGASANDSLIFFESTLPLTSGVPSGIQNLFVWNRLSGQVSFVGELPVGQGGGAPSGGSFGGPYSWIQADASIGGSFQRMYVGADHAFSSNGNLAYFTAGATGQLYLRGGIAVGAPQTVRVSAPNRGVEDAYVEEEGTEGQVPAAFQMATPDGSRAFFLSSQKLTADATTGERDEGKDLYRFDAASTRLVDLTSDSYGQTPNGAEVQGVLGISEDGSSVYFVANGVLAPGAQAGNCNNLSTALELQSRVCNLYHYDESSSPRITFVARLEGTGGLRGFEANDVRNWSPALSPQVHGGAETMARTSRVSADGGVLLFSSYRSLTGYDNDCGTSEGSNQAGACPEFYRYVAATGQIDCVSCDPTGAPPVGIPSLYSPQVGYGVGARAAAFLTRNLSRDGDRVFFQTSDPLVATDTNGAGGCELEGRERFVTTCQDVYEWEAPDPTDPTDSCHSTVQDGGCLYLISTGQAGAPASIADVDEGGENVFFFTRAKLVPVDQDNLLDIYDARIGGGLASQYPDQPPSCAGEACQAAASPPPPTSAPSSSTLVGPGNPKGKASKKCIESHGRQCRKRRRHKRHHKRHMRKHARRSVKGNGKSKGGAK